MEYDERLRFFQAAWSAALSAETLAALAAASSFRQGQDGLRLFNKGDAADALYSIVSGQVRFTRENQLGAEMVLTILGAGEVFGDLSIVSRRPRSHHAVCADGTGLLVIKAADFCTLLDAHRDLMWATLRRTAERTHELFGWLEDSLLLRVGARLAKCLTRLAADHGRPFEGGIKIDVSLTQDDLAKMIGATRQSVNGQLLAWQGKGYINQQYGRIELLLPDRLVQIASEE